MLESEIVFKSQINCIAYEKLNLYFNLKTKQTRIIMLMIGKWR